ncbi:MAG: hypothetical protein WCK32_04355 [Chlorobiaceae bacterium]
MNHLRFSSPAYRKQPIPLKPRNAHAACIRLMAERFEERHGMRSMDDVHGFRVDDNVQSVILSTLKGKNFLGLSVSAGANPFLSDNKDADMQLLKSKYPNLNDWPVEINIPDGSTWKILPD